MPIELTRRQTLQSLATAAAFATGAGSLLGLAGCGGSGGGSSSGGSDEPLRLTRTTARIVLPAGSKAPALAALKVGTSCAQTVPDAKGEAQVTVFNGGPQFAEALDATGRLVVCGFVGGKRKSLDAASTAEVLTFMRVGGATVPIDGRELSLEGTRGLAGFQAVVDGVSNGLTTVGFVDVDDAALVAALDAVYTAAGGGKGRSGGAAASTRGTTVQPVTTASGVVLDTITDDQVTLTNTYLRRGLVWIDTVSHKVQQGETVTTVKAAYKEAEPFKLEAPKRFSGVIGTFADVIEGKIAWTPTKAGPKPIPAAFPGVAGCVETTYEMTVVGPGFSAGDRAKLGPKREEAAQYVLVEAFVFDYLLPAVLSLLLPVTGKKFDALAGSPGLTRVVTDLTKTVFYTVPAVGVEIWKGDYFKAALILNQAGLLSSHFMPLLVDVLVEYAKSQATSAAEAEAIGARAKSILNTIKWLNVIVRVGESAIIVHDLARSNQADLFTIVSTAGKVTLKSDKATVEPGGFAEITATIQNKNKDAVYKYEWSVDAGYRLLIGGKTTDDAPGGVLASNSDRATLEPKTANEGTATVMCKVTRIDGDPDRVVATGAVGVKFGKGTGPIPLAGALLFEAGRADSNGIHEMRIYVLVPKLAGTHGYHFGFAAPKYDWKRNVSITFGPETSGWGSSWNESAPDTLPKLVNGRYAFHLTTLYCNQFTQDTPDNFAALESGLIAAWGGINVNAEAYPQ